MGSVRCVLVNVFMVHVSCPTSSEVLVEGGLREEIGMMF